MADADVQPINDELGVKEDTKPEAVEPTQESIVENEVKPKDEPKPEPAAPGLPDYMTDPDAVLKDTTATWRAGGPPDYSTTRKFYAQSKPFNVFYFDFDMKSNQNQHSKTNEPRTTQPPKSSREPGQELGD
jgi:hypothetical protein